MNFSGTRKELANKILFFSQYNKIFTEYFNFIIAKILITFIIIKFAIGYHKFFTSF